jgi:hypothetical protein
LRDLKHALAELFDSGRLTHRSSMLYFISS